MIALVEYSPQMLSMTPHPHSPCSWSLWMYTGLTLLTVLPSLAGKRNWVWARHVIIVIASSVCTDHNILSSHTWPATSKKNCRNIKEMGVRIVLWWCQEVHHLQFTNKLTSQSIYEHVRGQNARSASMVQCMKWTPWRIYHTNPKMENRKFWNFIFCHLNIVRV